MARGPKKHLKRLKAPKHWMLDKLTGVFAPRPSTGPHKMRESLPLMILLRNRLKYALTKRECQTIARSCREVMEDIDVDDLQVALWKGTEVHSKHRSGVPCLKLFILSLCDVLTQERALRDIVCKAAARGAEKLIHIGSWTRRM